MILKKTTIQSFTSGTEVTPTIPEITFTVPEGKSIVIVRADSYEFVAPNVRSIVDSNSTAHFGLSSRPIKIGVKSSTNFNLNIEDYYTEIDTSQFGYFASGDIIKVLR